MALKCHCRKADNIIVAYGAVLPEPTSSDLYLATVAEADTAKLIQRGDSTFVPASKEGEPGRVTKAPVAPGAGAAPMMSGIATQADIATLQQQIDALKTRLDNFGGVSDE